MKNYGLVLKRRLLVAGFNAGQVVHAMKLMRQIAQQVFDSKKTGGEQTHPTVMRLQEMFTKHFPVLSNHEDTLQTAIAYSRAVHNIYRVRIRKAEKERETRQVQQPNDQAFISKRNNVQALDDSQSHNTSSYTSTIAAGPSGHSNVQTTISGASNERPAKCLAHNQPTCPQPTRDLLRKESLHQESIQSQPEEYPSTPESITETVESEQRDVANFLVMCEPSLFHRFDDIINLGLVNMEWLELYARWPKGVRDSLIAKAPNMTEAEKIAFNLETSHIIAN